MKKVLLLSSGDPCRAIIAESILKKYLDKDMNIDFFGVGLEPNIRINKNILDILAEEGIDIDSIVLRTLDDVEDITFNLVFTMCSHSKEQCPKFHKEVPTIHMEFPIVDGEDISTCKEVVEKIKSKVKPIILKNIQ